MTKPTPSSFKSPLTKADCTVQVRIRDGSRSGFLAELRALADGYAARNGQHTTMGEAVMLAVKAELAKLTQESTR